MSEPEIFYRYKAHFYYNGTMQINCSKWEKLRDTPKGQWIVPKGNRTEYGKKWIPNKSKKRFAYPTKEEAWNSLKKRSEMWEIRANASLERAKRVLNRIEAIKLKEHVVKDAGCS